jgi:hypothetical protein
VAETPFGSSLRPKASVAIDGDLTCPVATRWIITDKPSLIILRSLSSNLTLHLCHNRNHGKWSLAARLTTNESVRRAHRRRYAKSFEKRFFVARPTTEFESRCILEANAIRNLRFQGKYFCTLLISTGGGSDLIFSSVQTKTLGQSNRVSTWDGRTEAFNWWKDLLDQVIFDIWL